MTSNNLYFFRSIYLLCFFGTICLTSCLNDELEDLQLTSELVGGFAIDVNTTTGEAITSSSLGVNHGIDTTLAFYKVDYQTVTGIIPQTITLELLNSGTTFEAFGTLEIYLGSEFTTEEGILIGEVNPGSGATETIDLNIINPEAVKGIFIQGDNFAENVFFYSRFTVNDEVETTWAVNLYTFFLIQGTSN